MTVDLQKIRTWNDVDELPTRWQAFFYGTAGWFGFAGVAGAIILVAA